MGTSAHTDELTAGQVSAVHWLGVREERVLRVGLPGAVGISARALLTGDPAPSATVGEVAYGGRLGDLVPVDRVPVLLVTDRLTRVLRVTGMTGWRVRPVTVAGTGLPQLHLLQVNGRCGSLQPTRERTALWVDPRTWDGSDLFLSEDQDRVLVSGRCAQALDRAGLRNVRLEPAGLQAAP